MSPAESEEKFQIALTEWNLTKSNKSWKQMFSCVVNCCQNICRKRLANKGLSAERINDTAMDAAIYCMDCIKRLGHQPKKLSSYCWLRCTKEILSPQLQWSDKHMSVFSDYLAESEKEIENKIVGDYRNE